MLKKMLFSMIQRIIPSCMNSKMLLYLLKKQGVEVGDNTAFFNAGTITVDLSRPALLKIGDYCKITAGTVILTHDYSRSVLRLKYGDIVAEARKTEIGNNVFIGINSIILMGTKIGDNCIVGAGSVCHGIYPSDTVIAGNPAKVICTLDEYYEKRKKLYIYEAKEYAVAFKEKYNKKPEIEDMGAFFPLYLERNVGDLKKYNLRTNLSGDNEEDVINSFLKTEKIYKSYDEFLSDCYLRK